MSKVRGLVSLILAGQPYKLKFDYNAICEIEESFGDKSIDHLVQSPSRRFMREAVYHGMRSAGGQTMSINQVGDLIAKTVDRDGEEAIARVLQAVLAGVMAANGSTDKDVNAVRQIVEAELTRGQEKKPELTPVPDTGGISSSG